MNECKRFLCVMALLLGCGDDVASGGGDDDGSETGAPRPPEDAFVAGPTGGGLQIRPTSFASPRLERP